MPFSSSSRASSPEPLALLIAALPPRTLLGELKGEPQVLRTVFQGFTIKDANLGKPVVRQRLERELVRVPELAATLLGQWLAIYDDLMAQLDDEGFAPTPEALAALRDEYGEPALQYGLWHAERDVVSAWAEQVGTLPHAARTMPPSATAPPPVRTGDDTSVTISLFREQLTAAQQRLRESEQLREGLQREVQQLERQLKSAAEQEATLRQQLAGAEERIEREQRRSSKAAEKAAGLEKQVRALKQQPPAPAATPPAPAAPAAPLTPASHTLITEAISLLQRSLEPTPAAPATATAPAKAAPKTPPSATPPPAAPPARPAAPRAASAKLTLPGSARTVALPASRVLTALQLNDLTTIDQVRDSLARLATNPPKEREALAALVKAGIPQAVLTGPMRAAVIDGSNVANMSPERRARLQYLHQARESAWAEGYFPVIIIVDASLRHQIDQSDALMTAVERGEIRMAEPGTSADELIIAEAAERHAVILTNDRMSNWPAAKSLEKRHVELHKGVARIGGFHRTSFFTW